MTSTFKYFVALFVLILVFTAGGTCHCDDSSQNLKTFRGQAIEVDWVGSLLTCQGADEVTFYAPPGIKIRHGTGTVSLEDLDRGDDLLIKYIDDPAGTPKAVSITLNKSYPEF